MKRAPGLLALALALGSCAVDGVVGAWDPNTADAPLEERAPTDAAPTDAPAPPDAEDAAPSDTGPDAEPLPDAATLPDAEPDAETAAPTDAPACRFDTDCPAGERCVAASCMASGCAAGQVDCAGTCADLQSDARNCGACGVFCPAARSCLAGACQ